MIEILRREYTHLIPPKELLNVLCTDMGGRRRGKGESESNVSDKKHELHS